MTDVDELKDRVRELEDRVARIELKSPQIKITKGYYINPDSPSPYDLNEVAKLRNKRKR